MTAKLIDIRERLLDAADLVVDFATLGEYGIEPEPARECERTDRRSPASSAARPGAVGLDRPARTTRSTTARACPSGSPPSFRVAQPASPRSIAATMRRATSSVRARLSGSRFSGVSVGQW